MPNLETLDRVLRDKLLSIARPARDFAACLLALQYVRTSCAPMLACVRAQPTASANQDRSVHDGNFVVTLGVARFCSCYALTFVLLVAVLSNCRAAGDCLAQKAECIARKRKLRYNYRRTAFTAAYGGVLIGTLSSFALRSLPRECCLRRRQFHSAMWQDHLAISGTRSWTRWCQAVCSPQLQYLLLQRYNSIAPCPWLWFCMPRAQKSVPCRWQLTHSSTPP